MKQIWGNVKAVLSLLGALVMAIFFFSLAVGMHQDQVRGAAQVPRYKADCSGALWYSPATPSVPCYDVETYLVLTKVRSKHDLKFYTAESTLPNGNEVTGDTADESSVALISGSYTAEIWRGKLTQILVKNQTLRTYDNSEVQGQSDTTLVAMFVATGIFFMLVTIFLLAVFVKGLQDGQ